MLVMTFDFKFVNLNTTLIYEQFNFMTALSLVDNAKYNINNFLCQQKNLFFKLFLQLSV